MAGNRWAKLTIADRLSARLEPSASGCWEWQGQRDRFGYGLIYQGPKGALRTFLTHRLAYELWVGPIPAGLVICHHCDNPPCVNPAHLFLGTRADNNQDAASKGRHDKPRRSECRSGHALVADNIYVRPDNGKHECLTCRRGRAIESYRRLRVGHKDLATTRRYVGKTPGALSRAAERIEEAMG